VLFNDAFRRIASSSQPELPPGADGAAELLDTGCETFLTLWLLVVLALDGIL